MKIIVSISKGLILQGIIPYFLRKQMQNVSGQILNSLRSKHFRRVQEQRITMQKMGHGKSRSSVFLCSPAPQKHLLHRLDSKFYEHQKLELLHY